ncbi:MAG TPA: amidohydrolase family protein, partial [Burkholderiaceae bacterium]|nr:amidohydrolase family protein [Burkholderiaceae bacterium]
PVLPGLVEAHTHLDKTFTLPRLGPLKPGLLAAIETMIADRLTWTEADVSQRAARALQWAFDAGVTRIRTHCDWWEPQQVPLAWGVLRRLADEWADRLVLERVSLIALPLFERRDDARALAREIAASGPGACLGGFVHTTNWNPQSLRHLLESAEECGLDVDLHCDEELNPAAAGLATTAALLREIGFSGRVVCGHTCALAAKAEGEALATLDAVARAPITLITLPTTNLLLQDATTGRTPRQRGLTLVKEARARGIPLLVSTDNVQDAFCRAGSFDPVEALAVGALAAQFEEPFDVWSQSVCRHDWLSRTPGSAPPLRAGAVADLVIFGATDAYLWPTRAQSRVVLRAGRVAAGAVPDAWIARATREAA